MARRKRAVLVVDDHPLMRGAVATFVARELPDARVVDAGSAARALELARAEDWSLVVLDLGLPDRDGVELLPELRRAAPGAPVLVVTMHDTAERAVAALRAGAAGFVSKSADPAELLGALRLVAAGERYLSPRLASELARHIAREPEPAPHERLSPRELETMLLLARGVSPTDIGAKLGISIKTVSTFRARLLEKLGLTSNAELTRYALERGLIR